jgi:hypothetical protein
MPLYPTSFFVWRPTAGAYLYYTTIYNDAGHVIKFINEQPPTGISSYHQYKEPFMHTVGVVRPAVNMEATRLRFYDFTEAACIRLIQLEPTSAANGYWIHREREIPVLEPACAAMLPREMTAASCTL